MTPRAILLGLFLTALIATVAPYNDYVRHNTLLIGNHLPLVVVVTIAVLAAGLNPVLADPSLHRPGVRRLLKLAVGLFTYLLAGAGLRAWEFWATPLPPALDYLLAGALLCPTPGWTVFLIGLFLSLALLACLLLTARRLTTAEMVTALAMMFIACALPTSGLFRVFQPQLASPVYLTPENRWYQQYINLLPDWMLPSKNPESRIIQDYYRGIDPLRGGTLSATWGPWLLPYAAWAFFLLPLFGALMLLCAILRKQWVVKERLAFPLAAIPAEMLAPPEAGRRLNPLWRSRLLWIGAAIPFFIHLINGIHAFNPNFPEIYISYDQGAKAFADYPYNTLSLYLKRNEIFFSAIGVTFFVPLDVAFSIWFAFLAYQAVSMQLIRSGIDVPQDAREFQALGMWLAYAALIAWTSRHHLLYVFRAAWRGDPREPEEPLAYRPAVLGLLACAAVCVCFLIAAGLTWWFAVAIFLSLIVWSLILARIVMESGILFVHTPVYPLRLWGLLLSGTSYGAEKILWMRQWIAASFTLRIGLADPREALMPYAANAVRLESEVSPRHRRRFFAMLIVALLGCFLVTLVTHHLFTYAYGRKNFDITDSFGFYHYPRGTMEMARDYAEPEVRQIRINRGEHMAYGGLMMAVVGLSRAYFVGSPFHPIGLLLLNSYASNRMWFSVMIGCILKFVILRWGGAPVYNRARPFFIGLLVGESLAGVLWIIVGMLVPWPNPLSPFRILPG